MFKGAPDRGLRHLAGPIEGACGPRAIAVVLGAGALALALCMAEPTAFASGTVPGAPTGVVVSPGSSAAHVSWTAPKNDGGSAITGYTVAASPGDKQCAAKRSLCTIRGLINSDTYRFSVRARNANGQGASSATVALKLGVPLAPTDVTASDWSPGPNAPGSYDWTLRINWKAPADDGNSITQYKAVSSPGSKSCTARGHTYCTMSGLNGTTSTFTVTATNTRGTSAPSVRSVRIFLGDLGSTASMGTTFFASDLSADSNHVWVSDWVDSTAIELTHSDRLVRTITVGNGNEPQGISSDGTHVWVADENSNSVTELDASDGSIVQTIGVGNAPFSIDSDGVHVWVANTDDNTLTELDASDGSVVQTIPVGVTPGAVFSDGTHVWVGGSTLTELDASDGSVLRTFPRSAAGIWSDGTHVWVSTGANTVTEFDASDGATVRTIAVPCGAGDISSDDTDVWVEGGDGVTELDASTGAIVEVVESDTFPLDYLMTSYGTDVWTVSPTWGPPVDLQPGYITEFTG
jgi:YVTN family beta-propeller protein